MRDDQLAAAREAVDGALVALDQLHHQQLRLVVAEDLDDVLEAHRQAAGPLVQQLVAAVDARRQDAEAARARGDDGLHADVAAGIAELARRLGQRRPALHAPPLRAAHAARVEQGERLAVVVGAPHGLGRGDHRGDALGGEALPRRGEARQVVARLRQHDGRAVAAAEVEHRVGVAGVAARRHELEGVAQVAADGALLHVGADQPHLALAVGAQLAQERRGAGAADGRDVDDERVQL